MVPVHAGSSHVVVPRFDARRAPLRTAGVTAPGVRGCQCRYPGVPWHTMTPHTAPDVMDKEQCAAYLGVGTTTIERWRNTEELPYIKVGTIARYRRAAIDAWLAAREATNHPTPTPPPVQRRRRSHQ